MSYTYLVSPDFAEITPPTGYTLNTNAFVKLDDAVFAAEANPGNIFVYSGEIGEAGMNIYTDANITFSDKVYAGQLPDEDAELVESHVTINNLTTSGAFDTDGKVIFTVKNVNNSGTFTLNGDEFTATGTVTNTNGMFVITSSDVNAKFNNGNIEIKGEFDVGTDIRGTAAIESTDAVTIENASIAGKSLKVTKSITLNGGATLAADTATTAAYIIVADGVNTINIGSITGSSKISLKSTLTESTIGGTVYVGKAGSLIGGENDISSLSVKGASSDPESADYRKLTVGDGTTETSLRADKITLGASSDSTSGNMDVNKATVNVVTYKDEQAIGGSISVAKGGVINVLNDSSLTAYKLTAGAGSTINIDEESDLVIKNSASINGNNTAKAIVNVAGTLSTTDDATITNSGDINVVAGGEMNATVANSGNINVTGTDETVKGTIKGAITNSGNIVVTGTGLLDADVALADGGKVVFGTKIAKANTTFSNSITDGEELPPDKHPTYRHAAVQVLNGDVTISGTVRIQGDATNNRFIVGFKNDDVTATELEKISANVTVTGSVTSYNGGWIGASETFDGVLNEKKFVLTVKGGTYTNDCNAFTVRSHGAVQVLNGGTFNISDAAIRGDITVTTTSADEKSSSMTFGSGNIYGENNHTATLTIDGSSLAVTNNMLLGKANGVKDLNRQGALVLNNGAEVTGAGVFNLTENGSITIDTSSSLTASSITLADGAEITIDAKNFGGGIVKVIDLSQETALTGVKLINVGETGAKLAYGNDGDVVVHNISQSTVYVNADYTGEIGTKTSDGKIIGINAFSSMLAAMDTGAKEIKLESDITELLTGDYEYIISQDTLITSTGNFSALFYNKSEIVDGKKKLLTNYDLVLGSTNNNTLTIGENVVFGVDDRNVWTGYYGDKNLTVKVDGTLYGGYQIWNGSTTNVSATGKLVSAGEAFVIRRGKAITVTGNAAEGAAAADRTAQIIGNYYSLLSGTIDAKNTLIQGGQIDIGNYPNYSYEGPVNLLLDNTIWQSTGFLKATTTKSGTTAHGSVLIDLANGSTISAGANGSVFDANTVVNVKSGSLLSVKQLNDYGSITVTDSTFTADSVVNVAAENVCVTLTLAEGFVPGYNKDVRAQFKYLDADGKEQFIYLTGTGTKGEATVDLFNPVVLQGSYQFTGRVEHKNDANAWVAYGEDDFTALQDFVAETDDKKITVTNSTFTVTGAVTNSRAISVTDSTFIAGSVVNTSTESIKIILNLTEAFVPAVVGNKTYTGVRATFKDAEGNSFVLTGNGTANKKPVTLSGVFDPGSYELVKVEHQVNANAYEEYAAEDYTLFDKLVVTGFDGSFTVSGTSTINIGTLSGNAIEVADGSTLKDSIVGGTTSISLLGKATFTGANTISGLAPEYYDTEIVVDSSKDENSLTVTTNRMTLGYGLQFNVTGGIADALAVEDKTQEFVTLDYQAGFSITGGGDHVSNLNVTNAYAKIGNTSSKNSAANSTYNLKFVNSIVDFTNQLQFTAPSKESLKPVMTTTIDASAVTISSHLKNNVADSKITVKNGSILTVNGSFQQLGGTLEVLAGSTFDGKYYTNSSHGGQTGTITVDDATFNLKTTENDKWQNIGSVSVLNGAKMNVAYTTNAGVITIDTTSLLTGKALTNSGAITIDARNLDEDSYVKVIDLEQGSALTGVSVLGDARAIYGADGDVVVTNITANKLYVNNAWAGKEFGEKINIGTTEAPVYVYYGINAFDTLAGASGAAAPSETPVAINIAGELGGNVTFNFGQNVVISGTADFNWQAGQFYIGRGTNGLTKNTDGATVTFKNATIKPQEGTSAPSTGLNVACAKKDSDNVNDGILNIEDSTIDTDYMYDCNKVNISNSTVTALNLRVTGRDSSESRTGEDDPAVMNITAKSTVTVLENNGQTHGAEGGGVLNVTDSDFVLADTTEWKIEAKGVVNLNGNAEFTAEGAVVNAGAINMEVLPKAEAEVLTETESTETEEEVPTETLTGGAFNNFTAKSISNSGTIDAKAGSTITTTGENGELLNSGTINLDDASIETAGFINNRQTGKISVADGASLTANGKDGSGRSIINFASTTSKGVITIGSAAVAAVEAVEGHGEPGDPDYVAPVEAVADVAATKGTLIAAAGVANNGGVIETWGGSDIEIGTTLQNYNAGSISMTDSNLHASKVTNAEGCTFTVAGESTLKLGTLEGTIELLDGANITATINAGGTFNVGKHVETIEEVETEVGNDVTFTGENVFADTEVVNAGNILIKDDSSISAKSIANNGTITAIGTSTIDADIVNANTVNFGTEKAALVTTYAKTLTGRADINGEGTKVTLTGTMQGSDAPKTNDGSLLVNKGATLTVEDGGVVKNYATLIFYGDSVFEAGSQLLNFTTAYLPHNTGTLEFNGTADNHVTVNSRENGNAVGTMYAYGDLTADYTDFNLGYFRVGDYYNYDEDGVVVTINNSTINAYADLSVGKGYTPTSTATLNLNDTTATVGALQVGRLAWGAGTGYEMKLTNTTITAQKTGQGAQGTVIIDADNTLTMDTDSQIKFFGTWTNEGTLSVNVDGKTGAYCLVDYTGEGSMTLAAYGTVEFTGKGSEDFELQVIDNDLWAVNTGSSKVLYVNNTWTTYEYGEPIDDREGLFFGLNAFNNAASAIAAVGPQTTNLKFENNDGTSEYALAGYTNLTQSLTIDSDAVKTALVGAEVRFGVDTDTPPNADTVADPLTFTINGNVEFDDMGTGKYGNTTLNINGNVTVRDSAWFRANTHTIIAKDASFERAHSNKDGQLCVYGTVDVLGTLDYYTEGSMGTTLRIGSPSYTLPGILNVTGSAASLNIHADAEGKNYYAPKIESNGFLNVKEGATATFSGEVKNEGTITVSGESTLTASKITNSGSFIATGAADAKATVTTAIDNDVNATVEMTDVVLNKNTDSVNKGEWTVKDSSLTSYSVTNYDAKSTFSAEDSTITMTRITNNGSFDVDGGAINTKKLENAGIFTLDAGATLDAAAVANNGTIKLFGASKLLSTNTITGTGTLEFDGATINNAIEAAGNKGVFTGTNAINADLNFAKDNTSGAYDQGYTTHSTVASQVTVTNATVTAKNFFIGNDQSDGVTDTLILNNSTITSPAPQDNTTLYLRGNGVVQANGASTIGRENAIFNIMDYGDVTLTGGDTEATRTKAYFDGFVVYGVDLDDNPETLSSAAFTATNADITVRGTLDGAHCNQYTVGGLTTAVLVGGKSGKGDGTLTLTDSTFTVGTNLAIGFVEDGSVSLLGVKSDDDDTVVGSTLTVTGTIGIGLAAGTGTLTVDATSTVTANSISVGANGTIDVDGEDSSISFKTGTNRGSIALTNGAELKSSNNIFTYGSFTATDSTVSAPYFMASEGTVELTDSDLSASQKLENGAEFTMVGGNLKVKDLVSKENGNFFFTLAEGKKFEAATITNKDGGTVALTGDFTAEGVLSISALEGELTFAGAQINGLTLADEDSVIAVVGTANSFTGKNHFANLTVEGALTIDATQLTIDSGAFLFVDGDFTNTGSITIDATGVDFGSVTNQLQVISVTGEVSSAAIKVIDDGAVSTKYMAVVKNVGDDRGVYLVKGQGPEDTKIIAVNSVWSEGVSLGAPVELDGVTYIFGMNAFAGLDDLTIFSETTTLKFAAGTYTGDLDLTGTIVNTLTVVGEDALGISDDFTVVADLAINGAVSAGTLTIGSGAKVTASGAITTASLDNDGKIYMDWQNLLTANTLEAADNSIVIDLSHDLETVGEDTAVIATTNVTDFSTIVADYDKNADIFKVEDGDLKLDAAAIGKVFSSAKTGIGYFTTVADAVADGDTKLILIDSNALVDGKVENVYLKSKRGVVLSSAGQISRSVFAGGYDVSTLDGVKYRPFSDNYKHVGEEGEGAEESTNVTINGGTYNGYVIGADMILLDTAVKKETNVLFYRTGDSNLTINAGDFKASANGVRAIAGGMMYAISGSGKTGRAGLVGDVHLTITGGTFYGFNVYGGNYANNNKNYGTFTSIEGNITVTLDASKQKLVFEKNSQATGIITAGSYGPSGVDGSTKVVLTGSNGIEFQQLIGGCSGDIYSKDTKTDKWVNESMVTGSRTLSFTGFYGDLDFAKIHGFNTVSFEGANEINFDGEFHRYFNDEVTNWNFAADSEVTGSLSFDFLGDALNLDDFTTGGWELSNVSMDAATTVSFDGELATGNIEDGWTNAAGTLALSFDSEANKLSLASINIG